MCIRDSTHTHTHTHIHFYNSLVNQNSVFSVYLKQFSEFFENLQISPGPFGDILCWKLQFSHLAHNLKGSIKLKKKVLKFKTSIASNKPCAGKIFMTTYPCMMPCYDDSEPVIAIIMFKKLILLIFLFYEFVNFF